MRDEPIGIAPASWVAVDFLPRMERAFGEPLTDVTFRPSREVDRRFGGVAVTLGAEIWLGARFFALSPHARELVLAHELVHVLQKRGAGVGDRTRIGEAEDREPLEAEAGYLAVAAVSGREARCRLRDASALPSCWGPAGHYWTCYFVMLAAGVEKGLAAELAFFCQMPDQVTEFDAIGVLFNPNLNFVGADITSNGLKYLTSWNANESTTSLYSALKDAQHRLYPYPGQTDFIGMRDLYQESQNIIQQYEHDRIWQIQGGLHCLTDGLIDQEVGFRTAVLREAIQNVGHSKYSKIDVGLALHAFGDSFAHQRKDGRQMYGPGLGHFDQGHEPDDIAPEDGARRTLYQNYVSILHEIVFNLQSDFRSPKDQLAPNKGLMENLDAILVTLGPFKDMKFIYDWHHTLGGVSVSRFSYLPEEKESHEFEIILTNIVGKNIKIDYEPQYINDMRWNDFVKEPVARPFLLDIDASATGLEDIFRHVISLAHSWDFQSLSIGKYNYSSMG